MNRHHFLIDNDTLFATVDGEIFGLSADSDFIFSLECAANILLKDGLAKSVTLISGHVITRA